MKTLTVSKLFRPLRWSTQFVPFIRFSGHWLTAAGFHPGTHVTVRVENGALIITPLEKEAAR
jgi:Toxin SymE, type I toxin-antitoxin system